MYVSPARVPTDITYPSFKELSRLTTVAASCIAVKWHRKVSSVDLERRCIRCARTIVSRERRKTAMAREDPRERSYANKLISLSFYFGRSLRNGQAVRSLGNNAPNAIAELWILRDHPFPAQESSLARWICRACYARLSNERKA